MDAPSARPRPRLVIVLSIDQFRRDYLTRFEGLFEPPIRQDATGQPVFGGFQYLKSKGTFFADARHDHFPLFTGPGHAVLLTGAQPYKSGIVGNTWFDHEKQTRRYCVEDSSAAGNIVDNAGLTNWPVGISPVNLQVSTVGDELRMATGGKAKVWGLALKDRAAVLMAGHLANGVLWLNETNGNWISSRYYCTNGHLPGWVSDLNIKSDSDLHRPIDAHTNDVWKFQYPQAADRIWSGTREFNHPAYGKTYKEFAATPYANQFVLETAQKLIEKEELGFDDVPDLLAINLSSNDYVGHKYGPDSAEVLDITVQTDRQLGVFFTWLDHQIGLDRILIVLTSDHGVAPDPSQMKAEGQFDSGTGDEKIIERDLNALLKQIYGFKPGRTNAVHLVELNAYIHSDVLAEEHPAAEVQKILADYLTRNRTNGYYAAYSRSQILSGALPRTEIAERVMNGFFPENSGDLVLIPRSFWVHLDPKYAYKTSHGSPYAYDTAVPLLLSGPGIRHLEWMERVSTLDLAPTLSFLLGILPPSGSEGLILSPALKPAE